MLGFGPTVDPKRTLRTMLVQDCGRRLWWRRLYPRAQCVDDAFKFGVAALVHQHLVDPSVNANNGASRRRRVLHLPKHIADEQEGKPLLLE